MEFIARVPYLLALGMALIALLITRLQTINFQETCLVLSMVLIIFYFIGTIVKNIILAAIKDIEEKKGFNIEKISQHGEGNNIEKKDKLIKSKETNFKEIEEQ